MDRHCFHFAARGGRRGENNCSQNFICVSILHLGPCKSCVSRVNQAEHSLITCHFMRVTFYFVFYALPRTHMHIHIHRHTGRHWWCVYFAMSWTFELSTNYVHSPSPASQLHRRTYSESHECVSFLQHKTFYIKHLTVCSLQLTCECNHFSHPTDAISTFNWNNGHIRAFHTGPGDTNNLALHFI